MTLPDRFSGPVLTDAAVYETAFSKDYFPERMRTVRQKIEHVRKHWHSEEGYHNLIRQLRDFISLDEVKSDDQKHVHQRLENLLCEPRDYADTNFSRPTKPQPEQYPFVELYCSDPGYKYIYTTISQALRQSDIGDDLLVAAVTLVEFVTIDLYNLRLSNLGDARYSNFQGVVYRGFKITNADAMKYKTIAKEPEVEKRHFSIPLGLCSTSTDETKALDFVSKLEPGEEAMLWKVHVQGMDQSLLQAYLDKYAHSVVTSICAMPVARLSPFGEKEVLLRGAFFQAIKMETDTVTYNGHDLHRVELATINANRDHTSEQASNEGEKKSQREIFGLMANASRYKLSASIATQLNLNEDAKIYHKKYEAFQNQVQEKLGNCLLKPGDPVTSWDKPKQTWLGGSESASYPAHYAQLRMEWQSALTDGMWANALQLYEREYEWCQNDWMNVAKLRPVGQEPERPGFTPLHELALRNHVEPGVQGDAWKRLMQIASKPGVWKTTRSFDDRKITAYELALQVGNDEVAEIFKPKIIHNIPEEVLGNLELQLHQLIRQKAEKHTGEDKFRLPQLAVLREMKETELWIPIPCMYGGFAIRLQNHDIVVTTYETISGNYHTHKTETVLHYRG